jgi:hypothetical protein
MSATSKWKHECIRHSDDVREYRLTNVDPPLNRFDHFLIVGLGLNLGLLFVRPPRSFYSPLRCM